VRKQFDGQLSQDGCALMLNASLCGVYHSLQLELSTVTAIALGGLLVRNPLDITEGLAVGIFATYLCLRGSKWKSHKKKQMRLSMLF
jgi:hypothetical protein